jgi:hypothetical protein
MVRSEKRNDEGDAKVEERGAKVEERDARIEERVAMTQKQDTCEPSLSVVLITPDSFATLRKTVRHLRAQGACELIELVIVAPSNVALKLDEAEVREFFDCRVVEIGRMDSTARARAVGVVASRAPVVAFGEDHSFPARGWAQALIERHAEKWAAVGPAIANANPRSRVSWANLLVEYAPWIEPTAHGEREHLPGHNSSYKRDALVAYGERLEAMLDAESILHWDLRARGHNLFLDTRARTLHLNFTDARASATLRFNGGQLFAAARARRWPAWKRFAFALGSPLIPLVRFARIARVVRRSRDGSAHPSQGATRMPRGVLPLVFAALVCDGAGEMVGYVAGAGAAMAKLSDMEFKRERYIVRARHARNGGDEECADDERASVDDALANAVVHARPNEISAE